MGFELSEQFLNGNPWKDNIDRSCGVLYFHFFWGICMIILGWTAFAARWIESLKPYHKYMGQVWVYGMIVQVYTSTYCRNNGFRWFIFMFGVICYLFLIIGHLLIRKFQREKEIALIKIESSKTETVSLSNNNNNDNNNNMHANNTRLNDTIPISPKNLMKNGIAHEHYSAIEDNENDNSSDKSNSPDGSMKSMTTYNNNNNHNSSNKEVKIDINGMMVPIKICSCKFEISMLTLKRMHGICMFISLLMVTGAGAAFTKRYVDVNECHNIYSTS